MELASHEGKNERQSRLAESPPMGSLPNVLSRGGGPRRPSVISPRFEEARRGGSAFA